jgi:RNA polymerase sigma factor (sigma-70 family)
MAGAKLSPLVHLLREALAPGDADAALLRRFAARRDQDAFAELVRRHGAMVLGVCRRVLRDAHDAEDAFQAAFLVLARKARSLTRPESVAHWLYGVAYRTALKAKSRRARRRACEREAAAGRPDAPAPAPEWGDLGAVLDEEINRLPAKYRAAFVLCHLEGKTAEEAARLSGCPKGTVFSRVAWARARLRSRLTRRGLALAAAAALLAVEEARALPAPLLAAALAGAGKTASVSAPVAALTEGVLRAMYMSKVKVVAAVVSVAAVGLGAGLAFVPGRPAAALAAAPPSGDAARPADAPPAPEGTTADVQVLEAELQVKRAELEQAKATAEQAKADLERGKRLLEVRAISQQEFDALNAAADAAAKQVRVKEAEVRAAEARLEQARRGEKAAPAPKEAPPPPADARDAVELAKAQLDIRRARTDVAKGELETAKASLDRLARLGAAAGNVVSEQEKAQAVAEVRAKEGQLRVREAEQAEAEVLLKQAQRRLDGAAPADADRLGELEKRVEELRKEVEALKKRLPPEGKH